MKYYILLIILSPIMSTQWFIGAILGGIGGLIGLGTGIANTVSNINTANKNNQISDEQNQLARDTFNFNKEQSLWQRDFSQEQFNYLKNQNDLTRQREDNAVQRRAADLEAAGLSKTLAAGSAAQASTVSAGGSPSVNNVSAPQLSKREAWKLENLNAIATGLEFANAYEEIQNKRSQNTVNNARVGEILANAGLLTEKQKTELVNRLVGKSVIDLNNSKTATENYNLHMSREQGLRTNDLKDPKANTATAGINWAIRNDNFDSKTKAENRQSKEEQIYKDFEDFGADLDAVIKKHWMFFDGRNIYEKRKSAKKFIEKRYKLWN